MLSTGSSFKDVVTFLIGLINLTIPVLTALALLIFLWAGVRYIYKAEETAGKGPEREALLWGLIALFVIFSIWGILRILNATLLSGNEEPGLVSPTSIIHAQ